MVDEQNELMLGIATLLTKAEDWTFPSNGIAEYIIFVERYRRVAMYSNNCNTFKPSKVLKREASGVPEDMDDGATDDLGIETQVMGDSDSE